MRFYCLKSAFIYVVFSAVAETHACWKATLMYSSAIFSTKSSIGGPFMVCIFDSDTFYLFSHNVWWHFLCMCVRESGLLPRPYHANPFCRICSHQASVTNYRLLGMFLIRFNRQCVCGIYDFSALVMTEDELLIKPQVHAIANCTLIVFWKKNLSFSVLSCSLHK